MAISYRKRELEDKVASWLCNVWRCQVSARMGADSRIDRIAARDGYGASWIEIRIEDEASAEFGEWYRMDYETFRHGRELYRITGLPVILVVVFPDQIMFTQLGDVNFSLVTSSEKVTMPMSAFKKLKNTPADFCFYGGKNAALEQTISDLPRSE